MTDYFHILVTSPLIKILMIVIVLDTIFGILRAIKEKIINSSIGIDGIIRKIGMVIAIIFLIAIDVIISVNLIGFLPEDFRSFIHVERIGSSDLFMYLFIVFEILSILKNMILCKLPIPKSFQLFLEKIMKEFTGEIKDDKN